MEIPLREGLLLKKKKKAGGGSYFIETEAGGICMNLVSMLLTQSKRPTCISTQLLTLSFCKIGVPCSCLSWKSPEVLTAHTLPSLLLPYLSSISPNLSPNMLYLTTQIAPNITWLKISPSAQYSSGKFFLLYHQAPRKGSQCTSWLPIPLSILVQLLNCTSRVKTDFLSHLVGTFWPLLLQVRISQWSKDINRAVTSRVLSLDFATYSGKLFHLFSYPWRMVNKNTYSTNLTWRESGVWLFATPWTIAHQTPLSMEFSR